MTEFFAREGTNEFGPLSAAELRGLAATGALTEAGEVRKGRGGAWVPATNVQGLFAELPPLLPDEPEEVTAGAATQDLDPLAQLEELAVPPPLANPSPSSLAGINESERYPGLQLVSLYYKGAAALVLLLYALGAVGGVVWSVKNGSRWPELAIPVAAASFVALAGFVQAVILWSIAELIRLMVDLELNTRRTAAGILALIRK